MYITVEGLASISIHALRKESDLVPDSLELVVIDISIHALRKESDKSYRYVTGTTQISIHALRKESDTAYTPVIPKFY